MYRIGASHLVLHPDALAHCATATLMHWVARAPVKPAKVKWVWDRYVCRVAARVSDSPTTAGSMATR